MKIFKLLPLLLLFVIFLYACQEKQVYKEDILIFSPLANEIVVSNITVKGKARGTWFFEASFPIFIEDEKGNTVASGYVETKENWMTEDFVPFSGTLSLDKSYTGKSILVLKKANPADIPSNAQEISIPIIIEEKKDISINDDLRLKAENLVKSKIGDISVTKPVLGGKLFVTEITWTNNDEMTIVYEDGHIQLNATITISVDNKGNISIKNFEESTPSS